MGTPVYGRKPPYQQGYEDGTADAKDGTFDRSIYDHDEYNDDDGSRDRLHYEEGYEDGMNGKPLKK